MNCECGEWYTLELLQSITSSGNVARYNVPMNFQPSGFEIERSISSKKWIFGDCGVVNGIESVCQNWKKYEKWGKRMYVLLKKNCKVKRTQ